jgi:hypothetical protein
MCEEVEAAADREAKLAFWEKDFSKSVGVEGCDGGTGETPPGSADTNGAKFVEVVTILVEGKEAAMG